MGFIKKMTEAEGLNTTRIIPPGSDRTKWLIENQQFIFKTLEAGKIGAQLTP